MLTVLIMAVAPIWAAENVTWTASSIKDLNIRMYGFAVLDTIVDSTQMSSLETIANPAVPKASTYAGQHHRTIMSSRASRLGFDLTLPKTEGGLSTQGIFEMDFLGNQGVNTSPGATSTAVQTEGNFYNNASIRLRVAMANLTYGAWNAKLGQTWSLLGWQPYYFQTETIVQPAVGQLFARYPQARVMNTQKVGSDMTLESALAFAKPAEMNSGMTNYQGGLRLASTKYKAATYAHAGTAMVGASLALSGQLTPVRTTAGNATGETYVVNALIPIIPSKDGKDASNNLSITGEFANGRGMGGLEVPGLSGGVAAVTSTAGTPAANTALDAGIAGISNSGKLELIRFQTWRANLQYTLPNPKWTVAGGYAEAKALNLADFAASTSLYPRDQYYYGNLIFQPLSWLRFMVDLSQTKTTYTDAANRFAYNNRIHCATFFIF
jgi:hypothetical protein